MNFNKKQVRQSKTDKEKLDRLYDKIDKNRDEIDRIVANEITNSVYDEIADWIIDILKNSKIFNNLNINWKHVREGLNTTKDEYTEELHDVVELYVDSVIGDILGNIEDLTL